MLRNTFVWSREIERVHDAEEQGRSGIDADKAGISVPLKIADPYHQDIGSGDTGGPRITKSPRSARLPCNWPAGTNRKRTVVIRALISSQHVESDEAGFGTQQSHAFFLFAPGVHSQATQHSV